MRKRVLIVVGLVLLASSALWRFGLAERWTQRIPPGWSWDSDYIGIQTYADPQTGSIPEKDVSGTYKHSINIVSETGRPAIVELEDRYLIRDINTGLLTYEYISRATVDPKTGAHVGRQYQGDYFLFPRNAEKKMTYNLRLSYIEGVPMSFQREDKIEGINTYLYAYKGRGEYTESYAGTEQFPGIKVERGQEIKCADDQFIFKAWVEPVTGEILKVEEGCYSGDYVYDIATDRQLYPVLRWGGVTAGGDVVRRAEFIRSERRKYLWATWYLPSMLLAAGLVCLGFSVSRKG